MRGAICIFLVALITLMGMPFGVEGARSGTPHAAKHPLRGEMAVALVDGQAAGQASVGRRCPNGSAPWSWNLTVCQIDKRLPERALLPARRSVRVSYPVNSDLRPNHRRPHPDHGPPKVS